MTAAVVIVGLIALAALGLAVWALRRPSRVVEGATPSAPPAERPLQRGETRNTTTYKYTVNGTVDTPALDGLFRQHDRVFDDMGKLFEELLNPVVTCAVCQQKNRIKLGTLGAVRCARCKQQLIQASK
jgi:hypothetical protein